MIPVAVVTGPVGVGKSTVLQAADALLVEAGVRHATVELEDIARFWPARPGERGNADIAYRNLASVWANYSAAGADRLLLGLLLEQRSDLLPVYEAIPGAEITVVRLHAPLPLIEERLRLREKTVSEAELNAARWWVSRLEGSLVADHLVDNSQRSPREVAADVLRAIGWLA
jgi:chloramphenicol 3-O-phosphotransferase